MVSRPWKFLNSRKNTREVNTAARCMMLLFVALAALTGINYLDVSPEGLGPALGGGVVYVQTQNEALNSSVKIKSIQAVQETARPSSSTSTTTPTVQETARPSPSTTTTTSTVQETERASSSTSTATTSTVQGTERPSPSTTTTTPAVQETARPSPSTTTITPTVQETVMPSSNRVNGAFLYLSHTTDLERLNRNLPVSLASLGKFFNFEHQYPIVILVQTPDLYTSIIAQYNMKFEVALIDDNDWKVNQPNGSYPEVITFVKGQRYTFNVAYRQMSRYAAGFMFQHPALAKYDYVVKMDDDLFLTGPWDKDPFVEMSKGRKKIGYWRALQDIPEVDKGLGDFFKGYAASKNLSLSPYMFSADGEFRHRYLYGCFIGAEIKTFKNPKYTELFQAMDATGGWFKYRWDEQKVFLFYMSHLEDPEKVVEWFNYVRVKHGTDKSARLQRVY